MNIHEQLMELCVHFEAKPDLPMSTLKFSSRYLSIVTTRLDGIESVQLTEYLKKAPKYHPNKHIEYMTDLALFRQTSIIYV